MMWWHSRARDSFHSRIGICSCNSFFFFILPPLFLFDFFFSLFVVTGQMNFFRNGNLCLLRRWSARGRVHLGISWTIRIHRLLQLNPVLLATVICLVWAIGTLRTLIICRILWRCLVVLAIRWRLRKPSSAAVW